MLDHRTCKNCDLTPYLMFYLIYSLMDYQLSCDMEKDQLDHVVEPPLFKGDQVS